MGVLKKFFNKFTKSKVAIDSSFYEGLEETLIEADTGIHTTQMIIDHFKEPKHIKNIDNLEQIKTELKLYLHDIIKDGQLISGEGLKIILFTGINGVGKTTSLAKIANQLKQNNKKIKIVAGDTFRAAAIEQLTIWAERINIPIIKTTHGADSGAIVFDGISSALNDNTDYLIIDTAGRMHTSEDLMKELQKINNICLKRINRESMENILVVDATTGQNSFVQAETFQKYIPVTGLFLSKYDSLFKGGSIIRISTELNIPIKFIGTGEALTDFKPFNKEKFIESLGLES